MTGKTRGGPRPGAGRPAGARSKATKVAKATLSELARNHTEAALDVLVQVARSGESESARVAAANAILDRGYGKPSQAMELTGKDGGPIQTETVLDTSKLSTAALAEIMAAADATDKSGPAGG